MKHNITFLPAVLLALTLSLIMTLTLGCGQAFAQKKNNSNAVSDYNLQKAYEVLQEENDEAKALDLVDKQIRETPDNVAALLLRVRLLRRKQDYSHALQDINHALKVNKPKRSEISNAKLHWWKAYLYQDMGESRDAMNSMRTAYELARKEDKDNLHSIAFDYAQALYNIDDRDGADALYRKMIQENEADQGAMVGLARNMIDRGQNAEAPEILEKCQKLGAEYSETYRFKMYAYSKMGEENKAIDAGLEWYDKDNDALVDTILSVLAKRRNYAFASIKDRKKNSETPANWTGLQTRLHEHLHEYAEAVKCYDELEDEYGKMDEINYYRSECYRELGLYDLAIADISKLLEKEPDFYYYCQRGFCYHLSGDLDSAIADYTAAIEEAPKESFGYYRRGWCYEMKGDRKKALEDYNTGIEMNDGYPYLHLMRGELLLQEGDKAAAIKDFEAVVDLDTVVTDGSCRHYALHFLGKDKEAEEWMEKVIALDPDYAGNYYDKACLYARIGKLDESVASLKKAFEMGYRSFAHIRLDDDMDPVRELPAFKELLKEYEARHEAYLKESGFGDVLEAEKDEAVTEIAIKRTPSGTFEIPCDINGLPLQMIFDTGASDVTISSVEANFMLKNGYLSDKDIKGKRYYQIANGQLSEGTVITLREVKIGDAVLKNVDASVAKSQKAPLLLGQSVMERFGTITIDNANNKIIIKR